MHFVAEEHLEHILYVCMNILGHRFVMRFQLVANCSFSAARGLLPCRHQQIVGSQLPASHQLPLCHCHLTSPFAVCDDVNNYTQLALN